MTVDERKRGELIASNEIAQLGEQKIEELRDFVKSAAAHLEDPPMLGELHNVLLSMMQILRPLTGAEIRKMADDGEEEEE